MVLNQRQNRFETSCGSSHGNMILWVTSRQGLSCEAKLLVGNERRITAQVARVGLKFESKSSADLLVLRLIRYDRSKTVSRDPVDSFPRLGVSLGTQSKQTRYRIHYVTHQPFFWGNRKLRPQLNMGLDSVTVVIDLV